MKHEPIPLKQRRSDLGHAVGALAVFACFVFGAFLLSSTLSGYSVSASGISPSSSAVGSIIFFILGIVGLYLWTRRY